MTSLEERLQSLVDRYAALPPLREAMAYSLMAGGKRLRPKMLLAAHHMLGGHERTALDFACALEMIHTYSLIHDDLPAMDNDCLRRGKPTSHVVFGEANAILAGDALLNAAFEVMSEACLAAAEPLRAVEAMRIIGRAAGARGMIAGQWMDLASEGKHIAQDELRSLHEHKTGAMFAAAVEAGAALAGASAENRQKVLDYAGSFGLAFQITDDILDVVGNEAALGKSIGKDAREDKCTYVTLLGLKEAQKLAREQCRLGKQALADFEGEDRDFLVRIIEQLVHRQS